MISCRTGVLTSLVQIRHPENSSRWTSNTSSISRTSEEVPSQMRSRRSNDSKRREILKTTRCRLQYGLDGRRRWNLEGSRGRAFPRPLKFVQCLFGRGVRFHSQHPANVGFLTLEKALVAAIMLKCRVSQRDNFWLFTVALRATKDYAHGDLLLRNDQFAVGSFCFISPSWFSEGEGV